jgi:branched-chain amino acid transport system substrate-binding protein
MQSTLKVFVSVTFAILIGVKSHGAVLAGEKKYDIGATDNEIKIGNIMPYSGPVSALSTIGKVEAAYFNKVNAEGGINGRKINFISYDDGYSPPKTVQQARKLVESDEVLFIFGSMGTPSNAAIQKYMNLKKVPQLFLTSGASRFSNPKEFPWTMGFQPSYYSEGQIYAKFILEQKSDAKIGVIYQNDDLGKDILKGFKDGLGEKASMIVAEGGYEVTEPTIEGHIAKLKALKVDVLVSMTTSKFAAQAIKKVAELGWRPLYILNNASASLISTIKPAGFENAQGIISANYMKDAGDPQWKGDPAIEAFDAFLVKYFPEGNRGDGFVMFGYNSARVMVEVMRRCGNDLTRENVMRQAASLDGLAIDTLLPDVRINTSATDYAPLESMQMMRLTGERWVRFGNIINAETDR